MSKNNKDLNWIIDEFTSIDLNAAILSSNVRSSETQTTIVAGKETISYKSASTENDELGRPKSTRHYNENQEIEEEYLYSYEGNQQKIQLFVKGSEHCYWLNSYDDNQRLLKSEYVDIPDNAQDIETFEYDAAGRIVRITDESLPDEDEPPVTFDIQWQDQQIISILEMYGDEEEARIDFEYDAENRVKTVRKYIYLIDDNNAPMQELVDEQSPEYNEQGQLILNTIQYFASGGSMKIHYHYDDNGNIISTKHEDYEGATLIRTTDFEEDGNGNLLKSVEQLHPNGLQKTDSFSYVYA